VPVSVPVKRRSRHCAKIPGQHDGAADFAGARPLIFDVPVFLRSHVRALEYFLFYSVPYLFATGATGRLVIERAQENIEVAQ